MQSLYEEPMVPGREAGSAEALDLEPGRVRVGRAREEGDVSAEADVSQDGLPQRYHVQLWDADAGDGDRVLHGPGHAHGWHSPGVPGCHGPFVLSGERL